MARSYGLTGIAISCLVLLGWHSDKKLLYPMTPLHSFAQATALVHSCTESTLVFFDVDDTLMISSDDFARGGHLPWWLLIRIVLRHPQLSIARIWDEYYSIVWQQAPRYLIDPWVVSFIADLQKHCCAALGLTSVNTGAYGFIENLPALHYKKLYDLGIRFSDRYHDTRLTTMPEYRGNYPELYKGMLCANRQPKGDVVKAFLEHLDYKPARIIFFDDNAKNLQSVGRACSSLGIPFTLYLYHGHKPITQQFDTKKILKQIEILVKEKRWVRDEDICCAL